MAVTFRYRLAATRTSRSPAAGPGRRAEHDDRPAQRLDRADLRSAGCERVLDNWNALALLIGGTLLSAAVRPARAGPRHRTQARAARSCARRPASSPTRPSTTPLTGLPNRALVLDRAEQMLARAAREPDIVAGRPVHRHRRLQARQRQPRARRRRPAPEGRRGTAAERGARAGHRRSPRRRRVRRAGRAHSRARRRSSSLADRLTEILREPVELDGGRKIFSVTASIGVAVGQYGTPGRPAARRGPGALRRQGGRQGPLCAVRREHVRGHRRIAWSSRPSSARRSQERQLFLLYQPIFDLATPRGRRRRGAHPLAASDARRRGSRAASSRWPRRAG